MYSDIVLYFFLRVFDSVPLVYFCIILKYCGVEEAPTVALYVVVDERPASLLCQWLDLRLLSVHLQVHATFWD